MTHVRGLVCRECGRGFPQSPIHVCEYCFGPLEVDYDYAAIARGRHARQRSRRGPPTCGATASCCRSTASRPSAAHVGGTPLVRADRWRERLGVEELWIKNDAVNYPTLSFKDRVVSVALSKARGVRLRRPSAAPRPATWPTASPPTPPPAGLTSLHLRPRRPGAGQDPGHQRLRRRASSPSTAPTTTSTASAREIADKYGWGFVNVNLRPFYAEGSKTLGYEIAEQLGWRAPAPRRRARWPAAASSARSTRRSHELARARPDRRGRAARCTAPRPPAAARSSTAVKNGAEHASSRCASPTPSPSRWPSATRPTATSRPRPIRETGGWAEDVDDDEIVEAMALLARTEGIFAETAGGVTLAATRKLIEQGRIDATRRSSSASPATA